jgi:hypothetical protein
MAASNLATGQIPLLEAKLREQSRSAAAADDSKAAVQDPDDSRAQSHSDLESGLYYCPAGLPFL